MVTPAHPAFTSSLIKNFRNKTIVTGLKRAIHGIRIPGYTYSNWGNCILPFSALGEMYLIRLCSFTDDIDVPNKDGVTKARSYQVKQLSGPSPVLYGFIFLLQNPDIFALKVRKPHTSSDI